MCGNAELASVPDGCTSKSTPCDREWSLPGTLFCNSGWEAAPQAGLATSSLRLQEEKRGQCLLQESKWQVCTYAETSYRPAEIITKGLGRVQLGTKHSWHTEKPSEKVVNPCHPLPWAEGCLGCIQPAEPTGFQNPPAQGEQLLSFPGRGGQVKCAGFTVFYALWSSEGSEQNQTRVSGRINNTFLQQGREEKRIMRGPASSAIRELRGVKRNNSGVSWGVLCSGHPQDSQEHSVLTLRATSSRNSQPGARPGHSRSLWQSSE